MEPVMRKAMRGSATPILSHDCVECTAPSIWACGTLCQKVIPGPIYKQCCGPVGILIVIPDPGLDPGIDFDKGSGSNYVVMVHCD